MIDMPTVVKVLKCLRDGKGGKTEEEISDSIKEGEYYVSEALERLVKEDIIAREGKLYHYNATPRAEDFSGKMFKLYEKVIQKLHKEWLVRGLLSSTPSHYPLRESTLVEVLEREGFDTEETSTFLAQEIEQGYIEKSKIVFMGTKPSAIPPFRFCSRVRFTTLDEYEELKEEGKNSGLAIYEEDYLKGNYPPEVANPALEYLKRRRKEMEWVRYFGF